MFSVLLCSRMKGNGDSRLLGFLDSIQKQSKDYSLFEVLIKFDYDDDISLDIVKNFDKYSFPVKYIVDERGRGAMDFHIGYTTLLSISNPNADFFVPMADDFEVKEGWELILNRSLLIMGEKDTCYENHVIYRRNADDIFIIQHAKYPKNLEFEFDEIENVTGLEVAPAFSRALVFLCGGFGQHSFTDAWAVLLQHELKHKHNIEITVFQHQKYVERLEQGVGMTLLEQSNRAGQRMSNFELMKTQFYKDLIRVQAEAIANYHRDREYFKEGSIKDMRADIKSR